MKLQSKAQSAEYRWRLQLSEAIARVDGTVAERTELIEQLAQETPKRVAGQTADEAACIMLRTYRRGLA